MNEYERGVGMIRKMTDLLASDRQILKDYSKKELKGPWQMPLMDPRTAKTFYDPKTKQEINERRVKPRS
jgi:hypothetical protein